MKRRNFRQWAAAAVIAAVFALAATLWVAGAAQQKKPGGTQPQLPPGVKLPPGIKMPTQEQMQARWPGKKPLAIEVIVQDSAHFEKTPGDSGWKCSGDPGMSYQIRADMHQKPAGLNSFVFSLEPSQENEVAAAVAAAQALERYSAELFEQISKTNSDKERKQLEAQMEELQRKMQQPQQAMGTPVHVRVGSWQCVRGEGKTRKQREKEGGPAAETERVSVAPGPGPGTFRVRLQVIPELPGLGGNFSHFAVLGLYPVANEEGEVANAGTGFQLTNADETARAAAAAGVGGVTMEDASRMKADMFPTTPPFVLTEDDFQKGVQKTYRFSKQWRDPAGGEGWEVVHNLSGTLRFGYKPEYEMTIEPLGNYEKWLPVPVGHEKIFGPSAPLVFLAKIKPKKDSPPAKSRIDFYLIDVSRHKGQCNNYPKNAAEKDADLRFAAEQPPQSDRNIKVVVDDKDPKHAYTEGKAAEAKVKVEAMDAGAYGKIQAEAKDLSLQAKFEQTGESQISIPKDDDHNHIADGWEKDHNKGDWDEEDEPAGQKTKGDGIPKYKEYRGFVVLIGGQQKHVRTNPKQKEIFVIDESNLLNAKLWYQASGITALRLDRDLIQGTETEPAEVARLRKMTDNFLDNVNFDGPPEDKLVDFNSGPDDPPGKKYAITILAPDTDDESCVQGSTLYYGKAKGAMVSLIFTARVANKVRVGCRKQELGAPFAPGLIPVLEMAATDPSGEGPGSPFKKGWWPYNITFQEVQAAWGTVMTGRKGGAEAPEVMEFIRRYTELTVIHEMGHAIQIGHHKPIDNEGEETCPMRYFDSPENRHITIDVLRGRTTGAMLGQSECVLPSRVLGPD